MADRFRLEVPVPTHEPYEDSVLGRAIWDEASGDWGFTLVVPSGLTIEGSIRPEDNALHLASPKLNDSRECVRWVRDHELALRQYVADQMYDMMLDWHNEEWGQPLSKDQFRDKITLVGVQVLEDHRASLIFSDAECFGGHAITFSVGADGKLNEEPYLWG